VGGREREDKEGERGGRKNEMKCKDKRVKERERER
jgi:hypothetical protein